MEILEAQMVKSVSNLYFCLEFPNFSWTCICLSPLFFFLTLNFLERIVVSLDHLKK